MSSVRNLNVRKDLYSEKQNNKISDTSLENELYAPMDSSAATFTRKIISALDRGKTPVFDLEGRKFLWQFYLYNFRKRHPDASNFDFKRIDTEAVKINVAELFANSGHDYQTVLRDLEEIDFDDDFRNSCIQRARASQGEEILQIFSMTGVQFFTAQQKSSFVLPDNSFLPRAGLGTKKSRIFIPISPKYVISPIGNSQKSFKFNSDENTVRKINEALYLGGNTILSKSKPLITSLVRHIDNVNLSEL